MTNKNSSEDSKIYEDDKLDFQKSIKLTNKYENRLYLKLWGTILLISIIPIVYFLIIVIIKQIFVFSESINQLLIRAQIGVSMTEPYITMFTLFILFLIFLYSYFKLKKTHFKDGKLRIYRSTKFLISIILISLIPSLGSSFFIYLFHPLMHLDLYIGMAFQNLLISITYIFIYIFMKDIIKDYKFKEILISGLITTLLSGFIFFGCFIFHIDNLLGLGGRSIGIVSERTYSGASIITFTTYYSVAEFITVYIFLIIFLIINIILAIFSFIKSSKILEG
ncbi:MAG: hypothetical protein P8Y97_10175 [Candidatus Lokiarchaeota archaeon]